jgi:hypothetical protein
MTTPSSLLIDLPQKVATTMSAPVIDVTAVDSRPKKRVLRNRQDEHSLRRQSDRDRSQGCQIIINVLDLVKSLICHLESVKIHIGIPD